MIAAFTNNWKLYMAEALGLAIFMISACFFSALLEGNTRWHQALLAYPFLRQVLSGLLMGGTALFIFQFPVTRSSGALINPAVTLAFLHLGKIKMWDAVFYIFFQFVGGTLAVYAMALLLQKPLTDLPVNYAATVPGRQGAAVAFVVEFVIAFIMMTVVLVTSSRERTKKYTPYVAACLVCLYATFAVPLSGFGMNPARSFASALPSGTWTAFWIYLLVPVVSMWLAAEAFLRVRRKQQQKQVSTGKAQQRVRHLPLKTTGPRKRVN